MSYEKELTSSIVVIPAKAGISQLPMPDPARLRRNLYSSEAGRRDDKTGDDKNG